MLASYLLVDRTSWKGVVLQRVFQIRHELLRQWPYLQIESTTQRQIYPQIAQLAQDCPQKIIILGSQETLHMALDALMYVPESIRKNLQIGFWEVSLIDLVLGWNQGLFQLKQALETFKSATAVPVDVLKVDWKVTSGSSQSMYLWEGFQVIPPEKGCLNLKKEEEQAFSTPNSWSFHFHKSSLCSLEIPPKELVAYRKVCAKEGFKQVPWLHWKRWAFPKQKQGYMFDLDAGEVTSPNTFFQLKFLNEQHRCQQLQIQVMRKALPLLTSHTPAKLKLPLKEQVLSSTPVPEPKGSVSRL